MTDTSTEISSLDLGISVATIGGVTKSEAPLIHP